MPQILNRPSRTGRLAREGATVAGGQIVNVLGALLLVKVVTSNLAPEEYGHITLALTVVTLIHQVIMGGTLNSIGRYYPIALEAGAAASFLHSSKILISLNIIIVISAATPVIYLLNKSDMHYLVSMVTAAVTLSILNAINGAMSSIQNAARNRGLVAFHLALDSWLKIALVLIVVWMMGENSLAVIISYVISAAIVMVSQLISFRFCELSFDGARENLTSWIRKMGRYSWPFVAWGGFTWAQFASDRWSLQAFSNSADVGLYSVVYQLGFVPIGIATNIVANFFGPILYQRSGDARSAQRNSSVHKISWSITYLCLLFTGAATGVAFLLHEWVFEFMVSKEYRSVSYLLPPMILAGGMFAAGELLALKLMAELRVSSMISTKILTSLFGLLLNIIGAMVFGVVGVVGAQVIYTGLYLSRMVILSRREVAESFT